MRAGLGALDHFDADGLSVIAEGIYEGQQTTRVVGGVWAGEAWASNGSCSFFAAGGSAVFPLAEAVIVNNAAIGTTSTSFMVVAFWSSLNRKGQRGASAIGSNHRCC